MFGAAPEEPILRETGCLTTADKFALQIGDHVRWTDPDNDCCTGNYFIQDIIGYDRQVEDMDTMLILCNPENGDLFEVYVSELV